IEKAKRYYEQSFAIAQETQDQCSEGRVLGLLGTLAQIKGQREEAKQHYEQSLAIAQSVHDQYGKGLAHFYLGQLSACCDERTETCFHQALKLLREQDMMKYAEVALIFGILLIRQGDKHEDGRPLIEESLNLFAHMGLPNQKATNALMVQFECNDPAVGSPVQLSDKQVEGNRGNV
ncbi:MAG: tetratricopeptide repeat protein, partial [Ktedonobacteraceae bacterium]